jgi:thiamine biosynthesis lipoprotein
MLRAIILIVITSQLNLFSQSTTYYLMGTYAQIDLGNTLLNKEVYNQLQKIEQKLSDYQGSSEISLINQNAGKNFVKVSDLTRKIITKSLEISRRTYGVFDITIGALTINHKRLGKISADTAKVLINYKDILIQNDMIMLKKENMAIDLGGIGKGYAIEEVYQNLKTKKGFISIGGDLKVWGQKKTLAILNPQNGNSLLQMVNLKDLSMSTSGNYFRRHIESGDENILQVTVVHEDGTLADAYSTAILAMNEETRKKFLEDNPDIGVVLLYKDGSIFINKKFFEFFNIIIYKREANQQVQTKEGQK